jgi:hypothetical protein
MDYLCAKTRLDGIANMWRRFAAAAGPVRAGPVNAVKKQTVSAAFLAVLRASWAYFVNIVFERCQNMSLVNYVLIGLLGTMLAIALYSAKADMSRDSSFWTALSVSQFT